MVHVTTWHFTIGSETTLYSDTPNSPPGVLSNQYPCDADVQMIGKGSRSDLELIYDGKMLADIVPNPPCEVIVPLHRSTRAPKASVSGSQHTICLFP